MAKRKKGNTTEAVDNEVSDIPEAMQTHDPDPIDEQMAEAAEVEDLAKQEWDQQPGHVELAEGEKVVPVNATVRELALLTKNRVEQVMAVTRKRPGSLVAFIATLDEIIQNERPILDSRE